MAGSLFDRYRVTGQRLSYWTCYNIAGVRYASVQMPPTITDGMPGRAFGERRRDAKFGRVVDFDLTLCGSRHGDNVPSYARRTNILSRTVLKCSTQVTANK
jgi:hypothetical protein